MKKILLCIVSLLCFAVQAIAVADEGPTAEEIQFTPPQGWKFAETLNLPKSVKVMVVGNGQNEFPPSLNLGTETFTGNLKDYLKIVQTLNESRHVEWKDLGTIHTEAGNASLSQADTQTEWGDVRMMHVILLHKGTVYILTAAALKEEFPSFYKDFFKAMTSLRLVKK